MSELYDRVTKLLQGAADQPLARGAASRSQYLVLSPASLAALREELGTPPAQEFASPGTWLLGVGVIEDETLDDELVKLRTDEYY